MTRPLLTYLTEFAHRRRAVLAGAAALALVLLLGLELIAPQDVTVGTLALVPIVLASIALGRHPAVAAIVALASVGRAVAVIIGDIPIGLAALEVGTYIAVAALVAELAHRRSAVVPRIIDVPVPRSVDMTGRLALRRAPSLTPRELEVVAMAMHGMTAVRIAERLQISRRTVETHLARTYRKLGVHSKQDLIDIALDHAPAAEPDAEVGLAQG
jgi:DNA-binding CsgD family transcriptional regulator